MRWAREELEEDLLDLKQAVVEELEFRLPDLFIDSLATIRLIESLVNPPDHTGEKP